MPLRLVVPVAVLRALLALLVLPTRALAVDLLVRLVSGPQWCPAIGPGAYRCGEARRAGVGARAVVTATIGAAAVGLFVAMRVSGASALGSVSVSPWLPRGRRRFSGATSLSRSGVESTDVVCSDFAGARVLKT